MRTMRKKIGTILLTALILPIAALMAATQSTTVEVKDGTVVSAFNDQLVVRMANGEVKQVTVPAGFKFTIDGKPVGLDQLQPGTKLNAVITTTKTPQTVKTVQIKKGEVIKVVGDSVWFRHDGKIKSYQTPRGFHVIVNGKKVPVSDLSPGMNLTAEFVYTSEKVHSERDVAVTGKAPSPPS